jgi:myo-inositol 2-dehydrogenase/D-chiro-inositol 1-dehydrogenase
MIGFQRRFDPTFNEARSRPGPRRDRHARDAGGHQPRPGRAAGGVPEGSGGIFRDMLIHDFDIFRWILCGDGDEADTLHATGSCLIDPAIAGVATSTAHA